MAVLESEIDAGFFNLIHQLTGASGQAEPAERRTDQRQLFLSKQRIAPRSGRGLPGESEFVEVACHDLSRGGFSFFLASRPDFDSLVVALGSPPETIYMAAEVTHCEEVLVHGSGKVEYVGDLAGRRGDEDPGRQGAAVMVVVGCRFTERLPT